jgi:hypothetical protein
MSNKSVKQWWLNGQPGMVCSTVKNGQVDNSIKNCKLGNNPQDCRNSGQCIHMVSPNARWELAKGKQTSQNHAARK